MCDKLGPAALDTDGAEGSILITSTPNPIKGGGLLWASLARWKASGATL
jgi:hypothetical protein